MFVSKNHIFSAGKQVVISLVDHNEDNEFEAMGQIIRIIDHHQPSSKHRHKVSERNKVKYLLTPFSLTGCQSQSADM